MAAISVVIPTYNRAPFIARAVSSVLAECRDGDEVIVVDDGSVDDTEKRLEPFRGRIVYRKIPNGGAGKARNFGMGVAKNPLLAFLDSDDEWLPGKLDLQRALLEARPDVLFCFSDNRDLFPSGVLQHKMQSYWGAAPGPFLGPGVPFSSLAALPEGRDDFLVHIGDLYPRQLEKESVSVDTLLLRREKLGPDVRFAEDCPSREDFEFIGRLARGGPAAYMDVETVLVHQHVGERLTNLKGLANLDIMLKITLRVWGADQAFLAKHGERYRAAVDRLRMRRARSLLAAGRPEEARAELGQVKNAPLVYYAASHIPARLFALAAALRRPFLKEFQEKKT
jgi:glycosyltransferase involved in cell wall biosynthesis